jgi:DNA-binding CsgD family transcriptional regulator
VRRRLGRLDPAAAAFAAAVAILDDRASPAAAARLAGLDAEPAARAAVDLAAAGLLQDAAPPAFAHPLLRAAVEEGMPAAARAGEHARAARVLDGLGAGPEAVAAHLVASGTGDGDPWAVEQLLAAAKSARAMGAAETAAALLRRALAEPPIPDARRVVLYELGAAELARFAPEAAGHLAESLALSVDPEQRADGSLALAVSHYYAGRHGDAVDVLLAALDEPGDAPALRERRLALEAFLGIAGRYDLRTEATVRGRVRRLAGTLAGATPGERLVVAVAALEEPRTAQDLAYGAALAARAEDELRWPDPSGGVGNVAMLIHAGRPGEAAALAERLLARARRSGSPGRYATALAARGTVAADVGDLRDAEADLRDAVAALAPGRVMPTAGLLAQVLVERGALDEAEALLAEHGLDGALAEQMLLNPVLFARGMLRAAQGRRGDAAQDFLELGRRHARWEMRRPSPPWRSAAARTLLASGEVARARALAAEELELARSWDTPRARAVALRAVALAGPAGAADQGLAAAAALLEGTPWRLELAHTATDLGAALRRAGRRREARAALEPALDAAHACGAEALAARAEAELRSTGARPRRRAISGLEALTPTETRVAALAAAGRSNREVAQELFVSVATVETHLTRTYRKLDLSGRAGLAAALESRS